MEPENPIPEVTPDFAGAVEALVFAAEEPISAQTIARSWAEATGLDIPNPSEVEDAVGRINQDLEHTNRPYLIERWGGGTVLRREKKSLLS